MTGAGQDHQPVNPAVDTGRRNRDAVARQVQEIVELGGGRELLTRMHYQLTAVLAARPDAIVLASVAGAIQQSYEALDAILGQES